ncbi:Glycoside hydrolase [Macleaya cordata]|uniref:Glycoside hydrolase n=1 Tax=Macleaya cordata TaxID=56857 RepID=A0A200QJN5_MACCD|nr:Glycoside hydrolase [Macleaya cordata]
MTTLIIINYLLFLFFFSLLSSTNADLNVADYGATGDGKTDASPSFLRAWNAACNSLESQTTLYVPRKRYFLRPVIFQGPCRSSNITVHLDGILVAPDYIEMGSTDNWLTFVGLNGVSVVGGFLDGQGAPLWLCKGSVLKKCPAGSTSLAVYSSKNVVISNLTSIDAKLYHVVVHSCENVEIEGVRIYAPDDSPNTDGIHVQNTVNVRILKTGIKTGDDCISIGPGTKNLHINRVACGPGHGISIGSLGKGLEEDGVLNVTVTNAVFTGTMNGLRIKSWGRPSNGFVKGVVFKQVVMNNVHNPILIDQNYCPWSEGCPNQNSGIKISHVTYTDIKGTSASQVAMKFDCSATSPCKGIGLKDIKLTYQHQPAESFCRNIRGIARGVITPPSCL